MLTEKREGIWGEKKHKEKLQNICIFGSGYPGHMAHRATILIKRPTPWLKTEASLAVP